MPIYRHRVGDDLSDRYRDLLYGSYDCVDRIVLNAYFALGHGAGGFRVWWRRWHNDSDAELDNAHLMRFAGRFPAGSAAGRMRMVSQSSTARRASASTASPRSTSPARKSALVSS